MNGAVKPHGQPAEIASTLPIPTQYTCHLPVEYIACEFQFLQVEIAVNVSKTAGSRKKHSAYRAVNDIASRDDPANLGRGHSLFIRDIDDSVAKDPAPGRRFGALDAAQRI
jgi:hypothetical protein